MLALYASSGYPGARFPVLGYACSVEQRLFFCRRGRTAARSFGPFPLRGTFRGFQRYWASRFLVALPFFAKIMREQLAFTF